MEDFHPHHAIHLRLESFVDGAHSAGADLLQDLKLPIQNVSANERVLRAHRDSHYLKTSLSSSYS